MKRTQKKVLGCLGLVIVAAITAFAASIPSPNVAATTNVTDTVTVRVLGTAPDVNIEAPTDVTILSSIRNYTLDYANIISAAITLTYTEENGIEHTYTLTPPVISSVSGTYPIDLNLDDYGFGDYILRVSGTSNTGVTDTDYTEFSYRPFRSEVGQDIDTDEPFVKITYGPGIVCRIATNIYLGDQIITPPSPIITTPPTARVDIPTDYLQSGTHTYTVRSTAYKCTDTGGFEPLPYAITDSFRYTIVPVPDTHPDEPDEGSDIDVPDTGQFFEGMNISRVDYITTALIAFFIFSGISLWIIIKDKKDNKTKRRR